MAFGATPPGVGFTIFRIPEDGVTLVVMRRSKTIPHVPLQLRADELNEIDLQAGN